MVVAAYDGAYAAEDVVNELLDNLKHVADLLEPVEPVPIEGTEEEEDTEEYKGMPRSAYVVAAVTYAANKLISQGMISPEAKEFLIELGAREEEFVVGAIQKWIEDEDEDDFMDTLLRFVVVRREQIRRAQEWEDEEEEEEEESEDEEEEEEEEEDEEEEDEEESEEEDDSEDEEEEDDDSGQVRFEWVERQDANGRN
jgi:hypothetical protein